MFDPTQCVTYTLIGMKSKVLLSMLIIFIVLAGLWIMCGTIFVVREVEVIDVNAEVANVAVSEQDKTAIIDTVGLQGKNILFSVNQDKITQQIKNLNPTLKVQGIKAAFPNKVTISISRRVPVYKYDKLFFDADMYQVGETAAVGYVDIAGTGINFDNPTLGNAAQGVTAQDNRKIAQLKILAGYFSNKDIPMTDWQVAFDDDAVTVGAERLCLVLNLNSNVKLILKTAPDEDFAKILAYTWSIYNGDEIDGKYEAEAHYDHVTGKIVIKANGRGHYEQ